MSKRVIIADTHTAVREIFSSILTNEFGLKIIAQTDSGLEALKLCRAHRPDLLIIDAQLPGFTGADVVVRVRRELRGVRVLVFASSCEPGVITDVLKAKPHGFVSKCDSLQTVRDAVGAVLRGCSYFTPFASQLLFEPESKRRNTELSRRERSVLQLIAEGLSTKEMSDRLDISIKTIEAVRANIKTKLRLNTTAALTRYAVRAGLVDS